MKLSDKQLAFFLRQLGSMLERGVPVQNALDNLAQRQAGKGISRLARQLCHWIGEGSSFGGAVQQSRGTFIPLFLAMIIAGETAGKLPETLKQIAELLDAAVKRRRLRQLAMLYPCLVIVVALGLVVLLVGYVFPRLKLFFDSEHAQLPLVTRSLLVTVDVLRGMLPLIAGGLVTFLVLMVVIRRLVAGRVILDYLALTCSPFCRLHRKQATANFARALGMLEACGVPIARSVPLAGAATGNAVAEQIVVNAARDVDRGRPLSEALGHPRLLSAELIPVIRAGEQTGTLDEVLRRLADELDHEVEHARRLRMIVGMVLTTVLLGILVGWIVIAFMSAYFGMATTILK